jgi:hypothetical protein
MLAQLIQAWRLPYDNKHMLHPVLRHARTTNRLCLRPVI